MALVLQLCNFEKEFTIECGAPKKGIRAIIMQNNHLIAYFSKGFSVSNRYKFACDHELLALVPKR